MSEKTRVVAVRALPRPGFDAFTRGGHRWPAGESEVPDRNRDVPATKNSGAKFPSSGRIVRVTERLLAVLVAEPMLAVNHEPRGAPESATLDLATKDISATAHNASRGARDENDILKARKAALEAEIENEKLRAEVKKLEADAAARAAKSGAGGDPDDKGASKK